MAYLQQQDANRKFVTIGAVAVLHAAAIYALVRFAGRVYALGLLHGGSGLGLRAALRIAREN